MTTPGFSFLLRKQGLLWPALALGLVLRLGYASYAHSKSYIPTSSDGYETIALNLLSGGGYALESGKPTSMREPAYPLFIAGTYAAAGRAPWLILLLQCLLSTATAGMLFLFGRKMFDERVGVLAAVIYSLYPQAIYYSGYFFRETLATFIVTGFIWASAYWKDEKKSGDLAAFAAGVCAMVAGLTNSGLMPAAVFGGLGLLLRPKRLALYAVPLLLGCGLWTARNTAVQGRLVLGSTHGGEEFYQALIVPPNDLGTIRQTEILAADPEFNAYASAGEGERNAALTRAGLRWIAAHPALYASRAAVGLAKFWKLWPYPRSYDHAYAVLVAASLLSDGWLVPLGLLGLFIFRKRFSDAPAAWIAVLSTWLLYGLVHAVIRYRLPLMPTLAVFAAAAALRFLGPARARS